MAHGGDSNLGNQPEAQMSNTGDATMANTAAQSYAGSDYQAMSQNSYAQSARDSQAMSQGPDRTLGDLQITGQGGTEFGSGSGAGSDKYGGSSNAAMDSQAGSPPNANVSMDGQGHMAGSNAAMDRQGGMDNGAHSAIPSDSGALQRASTSGAGSDNYNGHVPGGSGESQSGQVPGADANLSGNATPGSDANHASTPGSDANLSGQNPGADSVPPSATSSSYPTSDGGNLSLGQDGKAQLTDANGNSQDYNYFSNNNNGWHTMYKDSQNPSEIADSMRQFRLEDNGAGSNGGMDSKSGGDANTGNAPLNISEPTYSAMHPSKLSQADRDFIGQNVPEGSKPIGTGINRQAWQTPDDKAVVVGPNDHRQDAPFLLQPEKTEVSKDGSKKAETFPMAESNSISQKDVDNFVNDWKEKGWEMQDNKISNFGRTADGKMWRTDPDEITNWNQIASNKRPRW